MTIEELKKDTALMAEVEGEAKELAKGGMEPAEAKIKAFRDHGVTIEEDEIKADEVGRMKLSDDAIETVTGGGTWYSNATDSCWVDYSCYAVLHHDAAGTDKDCWTDYKCYQNDLDPDVVKTCFRVSV